MSGGHFNYDQFRIQNIIEKLERDLSDDALQERLSDVAVSSASQIQSGHAKSALDAGWSMLRTQLQYKSHEAGSVFMDVTEDDILSEGPVVGYDVYHPGKEHIAELNEWVARMREIGTVKVEVI